MTWSALRLEKDFYAEGAGAGDMDGDGAVDVVYGPRWYQGPSFTRSFPIYQAGAYDPVGYSDNFFTHVVDINADGAPDVLVIGFPGNEARVYLNPGNAVAATAWQTVTVADQVNNESPAFADIIPGGLPEIVCGRGGQYGYFIAGDDPTAMWNWVGVTQSNIGADRFAHGLGVGDVDGDGRLDILDRQFWWQQPAAGDADGSGPDRSSGWAMNRWTQSDDRGGAQILVEDVDGDGHNDLISAIDAHGFGLAWYRQQVAEDGTRTFTRNDIMGQSSIQNPYGVTFSQIHALALRDIDGDGVRDLITGKRHWAHAVGDAGAQQAAVLYWFRRLVVDGNVVFEPHMIDDASGVGVDVLVTDVTGDGFDDVISGGKLGLTIHVQNRGDGPEPVLPLVNDELAKGLVDGPSLSTDKAAGAMTVPDGFSVDLIAGEPDLKQPIAMCFDARGRIWVAEGHTYPTRAPEGEGRDRIMILEDKDRDGTFETRTEFTSGLNLVSGIEVGFGGVWIGAAPYLMFIPDANGDDKPDSPPQVLLDGWGYHDTHETLNSFRWGFDGWLYGCHGIFTHSNVGKPGAPDSERQRLNAAIWRYHPVRHSFEIFAEGGSNPWGLDYNERGDWFMECCVIPHLFHVMQGARYYRQAGQHFNPYIYEDIPTIADHLHYGDGLFNEGKRDGKVNVWQAIGADDTSIAGGGHAHCGLAIYQGDSFPASYRGDVYFYNLHGHRMVRDAVIQDGSGYVAHHRPDFVRTHDSTFVGVGIMLGPDGSLFFSDWHDPQTCHNVQPEIWDRTSGRLFRVRYGDVRSTTIELPSKTDGELAELLTSDNAMVARAAARLLHERSANGDVFAAETINRLESMMNADEPQRNRLRAMWARWTCGLLDNVDLMNLAQDDDELVRGFAVMFMAEQPQLQSPEGWQMMAELAARETSPVTKRYLACALQRCPVEHGWAIADAMVRNANDGDDRNLRYLMWYGIEPLVANDPARAISELLPVVRIAGLDGLIRRRACVTEPGRDAIVQSMMGTEDASRIAAAASQFRDALPPGGELRLPSAWNDFREHALSVQADDATKRSLESSLWVVAARLGDQSCFDYFRNRARDQGLNSGERMAAMRSLQFAHDPELAALAASMLGEDSMVGDAVAIIADVADVSVAEIVISHLPTMKPSAVATAINYLASRVASARSLVAGVEAVSIDRNIVSPALLRQLQTLGDADIDASIARVWGRIGESPQDLEQQKQHWRAELSTERLAKADPKRGQLVYQQVCGACHQLNGQGYAIGPDLTGSNRANLDYLLENILAPNAIIGSAYQMNVFVMDDGRVVSGLVRRQDDDAFVVVMAGGTEVTLDLDEIDLHKVSEQSMMPTGLLEKLSPEEIADLILYLQK